MSTDIMGYRSTGGSLGQDQQVSKQLGDILTNKLPLLSSPGSVIENSLYYDVGSSSVSAVEMQSTFAKDRIVMSSMQMGASPTCYIPCQLFAGQTFWVAQLPDITYPARDVNDTNQGALRFCTPCNGWGFNAIQSVICYLGAANIAQIEIDWYANLMLALACCETAEKKYAMLKGAGRWMDNYATSSAICPAGEVGVDVILPGGFSVFTPNNGLLFKYLDVPYVNQDQYLPLTTIIVPIRLPFNSMCTLEKKLSLDTRLLTQPIQITLQTKPFNQIAILGGSFAVPSAWQNSTLQIWQEELSDKALSVRNDLLRMPQFNVGYPFQYSQSIPFSFPQSDSGSNNITYAGSSYNAQQVTINITSIINADLTTIMFMVTNGLRTSPLNRMESDTPVPEELNQFSPLYGEELSNIQLLLNGQRFFSFDEGIFDASFLTKALCPCTFPTNLGYKAATTHDPTANLGLNFGPATLMSPLVVNSHVYELNFSRLRSIIGESHLQNTARFTNQTFQLSFNVERANNYIMAAEQPFTDWKAQRAYQMQLHVVYLYNGVILVGGDGGTTKLVTN